ncbi:MAG: hypothetical protein XD64_0221 [Thermotoga sp. 47_83]|uniref:Uncharacterized protein n=1 Tax=Thermotoga petrophila TaxID=93929 RepID=A0A117L389_9THEM|nr:MAG: hypothetical protein XD57_0290 [Thermotoga petrophila]KUK33945.1 MAG: hypothetical protein XD64_0221 [Thermotoga sp. 47_83]
MLSIYTFLIYCLYESSDKLYGILRADFMADVASYALLVVDSLRGDIYGRGGASFLAEPTLHALSGVDLWILHKEP